MKILAHHLERGFQPAVLAQMILVHVMALGVAPFFYSPDALVLGLVMVLVTGHAIGIFFHLLHTHRSYEAPAWFAFVGTLLGVLSWRGPFANPWRWVAIHRFHHAFPDTEWDVHSPDQGLWQAFMGWFWRMPYGFAKAEQYESYVPASLKTPGLRWLDRHVHLIQLIYAVLLAMLGGWWHATDPAAPLTSFSWYHATAFVLYGVFVKTLIVTYLGNGLDILNHRLGYRNFATPDKSANSRLLGLLFWGGVLSWHNNHHAYPQYFSVRAHWWEWDGHYLLAKGLARLGLMRHLRVLDLRQTMGQKSQSSELLT